MQLTLVGHACWLVEHHDTRLLTDPVFLDPFEDGTVVSCPAREVQLETMPPPTAVFLSHRHPDHFDPRSLRRLPRSVPVLMPPDPMMAAALARLGFTHLVPLQPWQPVGVGGLSVTATPSAGDFPEVGLLIQDGQSTVFHQVDTPVNRETIARIRQRAPRLDVHLAMYASQAFGWFDGVPEDLATTHGRNLSVVAALGARFVVPSAAGFRFADAHDWLNALLFPITEERFVRDLARFSPQQAVRILRPGDGIEPDSGAVGIGVADWVRPLESDMRRIRPDRTGAVPPLVDDGPSSPDLAARVSALAQKLHQAVETDWHTDPLVLALRRDRIRYHLRAVAPGGATQDWTLDLGGEQPRLQQGIVAGGAELARSVAATALLDVAEGRRSTFHLRVRSRRSQAVLHLEPTPEGLEVDQPNVPDLLAWFLVKHRAAEAGEEGVLRYYGLA